MTPPPAASTPPDLVSHDELARHLTQARRVLVTGLVAASAAAARVACDIAEAVGAAIDFGQPDLARPAGPTIARAGEVTAAPEEMRDRADLVILWGCDPAITHPAIAAMLPPRAGILRITVDESTAVDTAQLLLHLLRGGEPPATGEAFVPACVAARDAIARASCVAIVTDDDDEPLGLEAWSIVHLVRAIAHVKPAFEIPLSAADHAAATAVSTWRYGAAGAIARADRHGGRFLPAEASAARLIQRGEVDCVLVIGQSTLVIEQAIRHRGEDLAVIRMADDPRTLAAMLDMVRSHARGGRG